MLTLHHIVVDGWSLPILLQEIFARDTSGSGCRGRVVSPSFVTWLAGRDRGTRRRARGVALSARGFRHPDAGGRAGSWVRGRWTRSACRWETTRALADLARAQPATVSTVLQARLGSGADVADRPAGRGVRHRGVGTTGQAGGRGFDRRPADQHGSPTRAKAGPAARWPIWSIGPARPQRHPRASAPGLDRDPPSGRPRPTVRHDLRLRELPQSTPPRCWPRTILGHRPHQSRILPLPDIRDGPGWSWGCGSSTTPTSSVPPKSRRW